MVGSIKMLGHTKMLSRGPEAEHHLPVKPSIIFQVRIELGELHKMFYFIPSSSVAVQLMQDCICNKEVTSGNTQCGSMMFHPMMIRSSACVAHSWNMISNPSICAGNEKQSPSDAEGKGKQNRMTRVCREYISFLWASAILFPCTD